MIDTAQTPPDRPESEPGPRGPAPGSRVRRRVRAAGDRQRRRKVWTYGLLILSAVLMVNALIGEKGYLANLQARQEFQDASASLDQLKEENDQLLNDIERLKTDPQALEDTARRLGLIKPGETLITLRDRSASRN